jgi:hypothetical protein
MNTSKISVETRRALVKPVTEFAREHNQPVGLIMAAVLWCGEKKPEQILSLINEETLQTYQEELARRAHARELQVKGMIKGALPSGERTPENVEEVAGRVFAVIAAARKLAIPALKQVINTEVAALGKKAAA